MSPDLAARRLVMAALAYYDFAQPVISDAEYDELSMSVLMGWEEVSEELKFAIGEDFISDGSSSGFTFKITQRVHYGAVQWVEDVYGERPQKAWKPVDMDLMTGIDFAAIQG